MVLDQERLRSVIESLLLISPEPVPFGRLTETIRIEAPEVEEEAVVSAIESLVEQYRDEERSIAKGIRVEDLGGALQLRTVGENAAFVRRMLAAKPQKLSKASLETLAVIAYRQPVTKPEVEGIRGVDCGASLKSLLEYDLIRILGKREEIGRPIIYGTTKYFLEFFGLRTLAELPTLREYHELDEEHQRQVDGLDGKENQLVDLAAAAKFLNEREHDPDLDALDEAVIRADRVRRAADHVLNPDETESAPREEGPNTNDAVTSPDERGLAPIEDGPNPGENEPRPSPRVSNPDDPDVHDRPSTRGVDAGLGESYVDVDALLIEEGATAAAHSDAEVALRRHPPTAEVEEWGIENRGPALGKEAIDAEFEGGSSTE